MSDMTTAYATRNLPITRNCQYCGKTVELDFDPETGDVSAPDYHSSCWGPHPTTGRFAVITRQHGVVPTHERVELYETRRRAVEVATDLRQWNPRSMPCGENLDIVVAEVLS